MITPKYALYPLLALEFHADIGTLTILHHCFMEKGLKGSQGFDSDGWRPVIGDR